MQESFTLSIKVVGAILGSILSGLGAFSAAYYRDLKLKEENEKKEKEEKTKKEFEILWRRHDELDKKVDSVNDQIKTLQGAHDAINCKGGKR